MAESVLIDTSAWICAFRKEGPERITKAVDQALADRRAATCDPVRLELFMGTRTPEEFHEIAVYLNALRMCPVTPITWRAAEHLGHGLAQKHLKMPAVDVLIASVAIEHRCALIHFDRHFETIASHSALKLFS